MLDAGHGGSDYGAIREGINEKDITLEITQRVDSILRAKGYKTVLVRSDDTFVSLEDRANLNETENPELFVSIHVNSAVSKDPSGIETHWYHDNSKDLAQIIHKHMTKNISSSIDRGLFKSKFYVINHTKAPAVLCEIGFLSNDAERNELITENRKQKTAKAIADGIIEYLKRYK
jgi:N-acetylmuramoyl-L-alanine amidase